MYLFISLFLFIKSAWNSVVISTLYQRTTNFTRPDLSRINFLIIANLYVIHSKRNNAKSYLGSCHALFIILLYFAIPSTLADRAFESVRNFPLLLYFVIETFIGKLYYSTNKLAKRSFVIRQHFKRYYAEEITEENEAEETAKKYV